MRMRHKRNCKFRIGYLARRKVLQNNKRGKAGNMEKRQEKAEIGEGNRVEE
jgi:hypothetical protein